MRSIAALLFLGHPRLDAFKHMTRVGCCTATSKIRPLSVCADGLVCICDKRCAGNLHTRCRSPCWGAVLSIDHTFLPLLNALLVTAQIAFLTLRALQ